jgi:type IV pilus assembly protein PilO
MAIELKMPTNQRDQLMLFACVAAFAAIGAYWYFMYSPKTIVLDTLQARVDTLVAQNESVRREIAKGTASKLKEEAEEYGRMLVLFRQLVPIANEVPTLLDQISTAARQVGLELGGVNPQGVIPGEIFDTYRYQIGVTGSYHRIAQFLNNIGSLTRIVAPMNLVLNPVGTTGPRVRPNEQILGASFEIQTYVAKTAMPAPAGSQ